MMCKLVQDISKDHMSTFCVVFTFCFSLCLLALVGDVLYLQIKTDISDINRKKNSEL